LLKNPISRGIIAFLLNLLIPLTFYTKDVIIYEETHVPPTSHKLGLKKLRNMKLLSAIILAVTVFLMFIMGSILQIDASSKYDYPGRTFILQDHMAQTQQEMLGLVMIISAIVMLFMPLTYPWLWVRKALCATCHKNRTYGRNEDGLAICDECGEKAWEQGLTDKVKDEKVLSCPVDGSVMDKLVLSGTEIVVDHCPSCKGTFLSKEETEELEEDLGQPKSSGSFSSGMILGMNLGRIG
jgi:hypothetical protein